MWHPIIVSLIYLCIFVGVIYLILWVIGQLGIPLPPMVVKIVWLIIGLVCLLWFLDAVLPSLASGHLPGLK